MQVKQDVVRIFLCNREDWYFDIEDEIHRAIQELTSGKKHPTVWTCGNVKAIHVGDRAYFKSVGEKSHGFFARGHVVSAKRENQLRRKFPECKQLSEAYYSDTNFDGLAVAIEIDSCVDYAHSLTTDSLRKRPELDGANFFFRQSGQSFRAEFVKELDSCWDNHVFQLAKQGHGAILTQQCLQ